ncbi:Stabilin-1 [Frankliniella fusca]|uniref:Stabilin-1 n=1 Tax=Frankliniella fusca TaxID=407009 RepID=A0AAE1LEE1_9NEOP|nr:Stabilin-1 [Frankliniella fusca]
MFIHEFPEIKKCFCLRRIDVRQVKKYSETMVWTVHDITFKFYQSNLTVIGKQHEKAELSINHFKVQEGLDSGKS